MFSAPATTGDSVNLSANGLRISAFSAKCETTASISTLRQFAHHSSTKRPAAARSIVCTHACALPRCNCPEEMTQGGYHVNHIDLRKLSVVVGNDPHDGHPGGSAGWADTIERLAQNLALIVRCPLLDAFSCYRQPQQFGAMLLGRPLRCQEFTL